VCQGMYVSLKKGVHDVLEIGMEEAVDLVQAALERKRVRTERAGRKKGARKAAGAASVSSAPDLNFEILKYETLIQLGSPLSLRLL